MKYNENNKPLVCMMTQSTCYKGTRKFTPKGVLWHSTGANNPTLKRYVQPDDNAADRAEWLAKLGKNQYNNDWNHINRQAGLNFWIGKLADGTVAAVQTMPWDYRPWGCGSGSKGSCNDTHIQFEICEDGLNDKSYWEACYKEACEVTAYLCKMFGIDPKGSISYNGLKVPTIIDHIGSHNLGLGSNHGDIQHWSKRYGVTMETVRNDVAAILAADGASAPVAKEGLTKGDEGEAVRVMQTMLIACGYSCGSTGADGDFGKNTLAGLIAFQNAAGLTADGVYGEADKAALEKAYAEIPTTTPTTPTTPVTDEEKFIWDTLFSAIQNPYGVAALMGNLKAESNLHANNLQNNGNTKLGMTDAEFTAAFDAGLYGDDTFIHDGYGYGLAQWTYYSRKAALLAYAKDKGVSIGDLPMQLGFLLQEIKGYKAVWNTLVSATSVREASDAVLTKYERPADQSEAVQIKRAAYGEEFLAKYGNATPAEPMTPTEQPAQEETVELSATHAKYINSTGTHWISNSGSDENGNYTGGQAGDQTGKEWRMRDWYSRPWGVILRYPDQKVALKIAQLGIDAALNDRIGYDQSQNRTYLKQLKAVGWEPSKITTPCEADCSAGVCANVTAAGYLLGIKALQEHTGTYTGNMKNALMKAGFKLLTDSKYLTSGDYLLPGDILLLESHHTATNVTIGKKVKNDWNPGKVVTPTEPTQPTTPTTTKYYRVRKSWSDKSSQIGAFTVLENAILAVDANPGYAAFDDDGNQVYPALNTGFTRYALTDDQLVKIARLCKQEQGTVVGAKAEASLMANQLETSASRRNKYGTGADGLYNWVRNGGWFAKAAHWMDNGNVSDAILAGVKDVLVNGNRTLPQYVDEHDCLSDIESISTGEVKDKSAYVQGKTVVKNVYGSTWTFWCFPDSSSDPFGYTEAAYKAATGQTEPEKTPNSPYLVRITITDLNYRKGPGVENESWGYIEPGVYTIVDEQDGWGLLKAYAEERNGWISLKYASKL